jgi:hypothetical protein
MDSSNSSYLTPFARAVLTGLFAGIAATFICIIYNILYRGETSYQLFSIINVSSLIFGVNIMFLIVGVVYYWFIKFIKRGGDVFYVVTFILISLYFILKTSGIHRTEDPTWNMEFHHLLIAMIIIWGIAAISIPVMFHSKRFEEHVL